jgi:hypothetical protein
MKGELCSIKKKKKKMKINNNNINNNNNPISMLNYADDMGKLGWRVRCVKEALIALSAGAKTMGLKVNEEKTKCTQATKRPITSSKTEIGGYNLDRALEFKYFGRIVTNDNNIDKEFGNKILFYNCRPCDHCDQPMSHDALRNSVTLLNLFQTELQKIK